MGHTGSLITVTGTNWRFSRKATAIALAAILSVASIGAVLVAAQALQTTSSIPAEVAPAAVELQDMESRAAFVQSEAAERAAHGRDQTVRNTEITDDYREAARLAGQAAMAQRLAKAGQTGTGDGTPLAGIASLVNSEVAERR